MVWKRQELEEAGFTGFVSFDELRSGALSDVPQSACAYIVLRTDPSKPIFLLVSTGGWFKGENPSVPLSSLESKWVPGCSVVYIGKADQLRRRLREFSEFGRGKNVGHRGGRYIWHLPGSGDLLVAWKHCDAGEKAAALESRLLAEFVSDHGVLPFANLRM